MIVRPQPNPTEQKLLDKGKSTVATRVSDTWFSRGGLEIEGGQLTVWDADGDAHPVPIPPSGALVRTIYVAYEKGARYESPALFVADQNKHRVAWLPVDGFVAEDLTEFAAAGGLQFVHKQITSADGWEGGYPVSDATMDLRRCTKSQAGGHGLFHRHHDGGPPSDGPGLSPAQP